MGLQLSGALRTVAGMGYDRPHAGNRDYVKCSLFFLVKTPNLFFEAYFSGAIQSFCASQTKRQRASKRMFSKPKNVLRLCGTDTYDHRPHG